MKLLWIPHSSWATPQRARFFCLELARQHQVHVTDWVADFAGWQDYLSVKYLRNFFSWEYQEQGVQVHHIPRVSPALYSERLRKLNAAIYRRSVAEILRGHSFDAVVGSFVVEPPEAQRLVLDLFDDNAAYWREYRGHEAYAQEIERTEAAYLQCAHRVVTVSSVLADRARAALGEDGAGRVRVIPNGVSLERYRTGDGQELRKALGIEGKKVVGLIALLHSFVGLRTLVEAARLIHDPRVVYVIVGDGAELAPAQELVARYRLPSFFFVGRVPGPQVAQWYQALDIGVIPHRKSAFTDAGFPTKLIEYTAAGKPVVSTDLEEIRRLGFPNVELVEDSPQGLAEGILRALDTHYEMPGTIEEYDIEVLARRYEAVLQGD